MLRHHDVRQRDDGMFEVIYGDTIAGPFPTYSFAVRIANGHPPAPVPANRRIKVCGCAVRPRSSERNRAALADRPARKTDFNNTADNAETAPRLQARRLVLKFGFALETAIVVAVLAGGCTK
jgi:hypothetical protein